MAVPDVAAIFPGVITPVPLLKTGVSVVKVPAVITAAPAVKDVATGAATTVTIAVAVADTPALFVTVSVYVVVVVGETETAVPDVAAIFPGVITPVPLLKTGVRVVEVPTVMDVAPAVSDVAIGPGTEPPPPLVSPPPPPPPPHATPKAKTRPRESRRKYLWSGTEKPIRYRNTEIFKIEQKIFKIEQKYTLVDLRDCNRAVFKGTRLAARKRKSKVKDRGSRRKSACSLWLWGKGFFFKVLSELHLIYLFDF
jgi:hypothetical protein